MQVKIRPCSLSREQVKELLRLIASVERTIFGLSKHALNSLQVQIQDDLLSSLQEYRRSIQPLLWIPDFEPPDVFDDHDQLASLFLYQVARFMSIRRHGHGIDDVSLLSNFRDRLLEVHNSSGIEFHACFPPSQIPTGCEIGIVTVLEHEYQSVVRRLDTVKDQTDVKSFGQAILDRKCTFQDPKKLGTPARSTGWTRGTLAGKTVTVICTGSAGAISTLDSVKKAVHHLGPPGEGWMVVGVCGASTDDWPLGSVLVSDRFICDLRVHSWTEIELVGQVRPAYIRRPEANYNARDLFRRPPALSKLAVKLASPDAVPVLVVPFACTNEVVNHPEQRDLVRQALIQCNLRNGEEFGIEMEAKGVAAFGGSAVRIVKAICDYADKRKGGGWSGKTKMEIQLYAAEIAADFAAAVIRRGDYVNVSQPPSTTAPLR